MIFYSFEDQGLIKEHWLVERRNFTDAEREYKAYFRNIRGVKFKKNQMLMIFKKQCRVKAFSIFIARITQVALMPAVFPAQRSRQRRPYAAKDFSLLNIVKRAEWFQTKT